MFALALFLSFNAIFVCDGYCPVGWNWKGSALHLAFWAMPLSVLLGSLAASIAFRPRLASVLLLLGTIPFIATVCWVDLQAATQTQSPWLHLRLLAAALAIGSDVVLIRTAQSRRHRQPQIAVA